MKKYFVAPLLFIAFIFLVSGSMFYGTTGKKVRDVFPYAIEENKDHLFETFDLHDDAYDDTIALNIKESCTWLKMDTMTGTMLVNLTLQSYLKGGEQLYLQAGNDGTVRTAYVKQGSHVVDTLVVANRNSKRLYIYNGTYFEVIKN